MGTNTKCITITTESHESRTIWHNSQPFFFITTILSTNGSYSLYFVLCTMYIHTILFFFYFIFFFHLVSFLCLVLFVFVCAILWVLTIRMNSSNIIVSKLKWWHVHVSPVGSTQPNFNYLTFDFVIKYLIKSTELFVYARLKKFYRLIFFYLFFFQFFFSSTFLFIPKNIRWTSRNAE